MTDEELISYRDDVREFMIAENEADTRIFQDVSKELISRLARGRKAIEAMGKIIKMKDETELIDDFAAQVAYIVADYQYSEKVDGD